MLSHCAKCQKSYKTCESGKRNPSFCLTCDSAAAVDMWKCDKCKLTFSREEKYQKHNCMALGDGKLCKMCHGRFNHSQLLLRGEELICKNCADSLTVCSTCKEYVSTSGEHVCHLKCQMCRESFRWQRPTTPSLLTSPASLLCNVCKEKRLTDMNSAETNSSADRVFQCIKCQKSCSTETEIKLHILTYHRNETSHRCYLCSAVFSTPAKLQAHLIDHNFSFSDTLTCSRCDWQTASSAELLAHCSIEHSVITKPFLCLICSQRFFFEAELLNHSYSQHSLSSGSGSAEPETNGHSEGARSGGKRRLSEDSAETELLSLKRIKMETVSDSESDSDLFCSQCDREFASLGRYNEHMKIRHTGE